MVTIPANVPLCHKNYDIAEQLALSMSQEAKKPWHLTPQQWESLQNSFKDFISKEVEKVGSSEWDQVEAYFRQLVDSEPTEQTEAEGIALASIDSDKADSKNGESIESILDLKEELLDRETSEIAEQVLQNIGGIEAAKKYSAIVDAAITASMTRDNKKKEEGGNYKKFDSMPANIKDLARVSEKAYLLPEMQTLGLYKLLNGELSAIKPVEQNPKELFVILDDSGSMDNSFKKAIVRLILLKVRKRALAGIKSTLFMFEADLYQNNPCDLANGMPYISFGGGSTNVQRSLITLKGIIKNQNASVLVINDGEDTVSSDFIPVVRTVAITIGTNNTGLQKACERSKGQYFTINK